ALSPGLLVYEEALAANVPARRDSRTAIAEEMGRAVRLIANILLTPAQAQIPPAPVAQYHAHALRLEELRRENYALRLKPVIPVERENDPTRIQRVGEEN